MFDMRIFKKMKKTSFLINTSRGKIVNEKDLVVALKQKIIRGAGLDVFETEPISKNHPFIKLENIVLAPHVGSSTKETRIKMAEITTKNLILGIKGKNTNLFNRILIITRKCYPSKMLSFYIEITIQSQVEKIQTY